METCVIRGWVMVALALKRLWVSRGVHLFRLQIPIRQKANNSLIWVSREQLATDALLGNVKGLAEI